MADLIDRDALKAKLKIDTNTATYSDYCNGYCDARQVDLDAIDAAPTVNRWISCAERLPEQEVRVLLFAADEVYVGELTDIKDLFDTDIGFMKIGHVTHWMPLPSTEGLT